MGNPTGIIKQIPISFPKWIPDSVRKDCSALAAKELKCTPNAMPINRVGEYVDPSLVKDMKQHMQELEKYLEQNPNNIEVRAQLARLREIFNKG